MAPSAPKVTLTFMPEFSPGDFLLFEVPMRALELLERGASIMVRGKPEHPLCFTTSRMTFPAKQVETTNTLLVTEFIDAQHRKELPSGKGRRNSNVHAKQMFINKKIVKEKVGSVVGSADQQDVEMEDVEEADETSRWTEPQLVSMVTGDKSDSSEQSLRLGKRRSLAPGPVPAKKASFTDRFEIAEAMELVEDSSGSADIPGPSTAPIKAASFGAASATSSMAGLASSSAGAAPSIDLFCHSASISPESSNEESSEEYDYDIFAMFNTYYEVVLDSTKPYLQLRELLKPKVYDPFNPKTFNQEWVTMDQLLHEIQASDWEIQEGLDRLPVIECDGSFRWLAQSARDKVLEHFVNQLDSHMISCTSHVDFQYLRDKFPPEIEDDILHWVLRRYFVQGFAEQRVIDKLNLAKDIAVQILQKNNEMPLENLRGRLEAEMPVDVDLDMRCLEGIAFVDRTKHTPWVQYLNVEDLPADPEQRMNVLFKECNKWLLEDIVPYVIDYCCKTANVPAFLGKYCRISKRDGRPFYVPLNINI